MTDFFEGTVFFGASISLASYWIGMQLKKKWKLPIFHPLLIGILMTILVLWLLRVDYTTYNLSAKYLSYFLTPSTICLAIPLYEQIEQLKKNWVAVMAGMIAGVLSSMGTVFLLALAFRFDHADYVTFLPKSITTAIGMGVSEELGGHISITVAVIVITGILGNIMAETVCKVFRITEPVAKGIGIGSAAHAIGATKAMEMGEIEGAMSSLSIVVSGILTVLIASVFSGLIS